MSDRIGFEWTLARQALARTYRMPLTMPLLFSLVPLYVFIPEFFPPDARYLPETWVDRALPLVPGWTVVYGALYVFLILLPLLVVRQQELLQRSLYAFLSIWITAYLFFFVFYPTAAPRPPRVVGDGYAVWCLRELYWSDPAWNCFPSLHVAHSFVSAFAAYRVNRRLGIFAIVVAALVAVSTMFTKQHYFVDVIAGTALALVAYAVFLARFPRDRIPEMDRRAAPTLAFCIGVFVMIGLLASWIGYVWMGETSFDFES